MVKGRSPGIYGSKPTLVRGRSPRTRAVYVAINPRRPGFNFYISHLIGLAMLVRRRTLSNTMATILGNIQTY